MRPGRQRVLHSCARRRSSARRYGREYRYSRRSLWIGTSSQWTCGQARCDVRQRAGQLVSDIEPLLGEPVYIFNDWHTIMAFGLAGRSDLSEQVISANQHAVGSNRVVTEKVGLGLLEGFRFFATGEFRRSVDVLVECLPLTGAVGGSHAQRDIINLTLIAAAARSGHADYARALAATRGNYRDDGSDMTERLLLTNGV